MPSFMLLGAYPEPTQMVLKELSVGTPAANEFLASSTRPSKALELHKAEQGTRITPASSPLPLRTPTGSSVTPASSPSPAVADFSTG